MQQPTESFTEQLTEPFTEPFTEQLTNFPPLAQAHFLRLRQGLAILCRARHYAQLAGGDAWDFAVELTVLVEAGLSRNELRLLVCKGLLTHRWEIEEPGGKDRRFIAVKPLCFSSRSCFVLTDPAFAMLSNGAVCEGFCGDAGRRVRSADTTVPVWDAERRTLTLGERLVKAFRLPAPNQIQILSAFEEEQWANRIDDPLPMLPELDPKRRLHDTIKCLNRNQKFAALRFSGDGTGQGVCWTLHDRLAGSFPTASLE